MVDLHLPEKIEQNIHQKLYFVHTKTFIFIIYNPVQKAQITDTSIIVTTQSQ